VLPCSLERILRITQQCDCFQTVEKENVMMREKLAHLRDELTEATKHITEMTGELTSVRHTCQEQEGNVP
jgi:hypothetical protein